MGVGSNAYRDCFLPLQPFYYLCDDGGHIRSVEDSIDLLLGVWLQQGKAVRQTKASDENDGINLLAYRLLRLGEATTITKI